MAARRYWPATRAERERERPMESLYRLGADIGFCEPRLTRLGKTWRTAAPSFAKSGEENERAFERPFAIPPIRSRVQVGSSNSLHLLLRAPSSKLLISQIDSPIFPRICRYSHSHKCFFSLLRQDLYETSKSIVDPSFTDLIRQFDRA